MYNLLNKTTYIPTVKISWNKKYKFEDEWGKIFSNPFKINKDSTVQWCQSRINRKTLATNNLFYKIRSKMYILHQTIFYGNVNVSQFFMNVKQFLNETISWLSQHGMHITLNEKSFIFRMDPDKKNDINRLV